VATDAPPEDLARRPLGARDAALLGLRERTFGPVAECYLACPACAEGLEFTLDIRDLTPPGELDGGAAAVHELSAGEWTVRFRLPGSADLRAAAAERDPERRSVALLTATVVAADRSGEPVYPAHLPSAVVEALDAELGRRDPGAELNLDLDCAACGHTWTSRFDVAGFLWREIDVAARRLLREIDAIARAYGWSEREILGLSARRRRTYLELVEGEPA
jgi:hypothetical protein